MNFENWHYEEEAWHDEVTDAARDAFKEALTSQDKQSYAQRVYQSWANTYNEISKLDVYEPGKDESDGTVVDGSAQAEAS